MSFSTRPFSAFEKTAALIVTLALLAFPFTSFAAPAEKVTICHATESDTNPFVTIHVSANATAGHFDNSGTPDAGHEDDILLQGEVDCPSGSAPQSATGALVVTKTVINDDGGQGVPSDFSIAITSATSGTQVAGSPQQGNASGTTYLLSPGSYTVSELMASSSYATTYSGSCDPQGSVTVTQNGTSTCTIINNDVPRETPLATSTLTIIKNTTGGNGTFDFTVGSGTTSVTTIGGTGSVQIPLPTIGTTTVTESMQGGWVFGSASCMLNSTSTGVSMLNGFQFLNASMGSNFTCTFNNVATSTPVGTTTGTLIVQKIVVNNDGGAATSSDFVIHVLNATSSDVLGSPTIGAATGTSYTLMPGNYRVQENASSTYTAVYSGACDANGNVAVSSDATSTCIITNHDNAGFLTLVKHAIGGNGMFTFLLGAGSSTATTTITTAGGFGTTTIPLVFGTSTISEMMLGGWAHSNTMCMLNGTTTGTGITGGMQLFNGAFGNSFTCTFTNNATSTPGGGGGTTTPATLIVIKQVVNDNGGMATSSDFRIHVQTASSTDVAGSPVWGNATGTAFSLNAGTYTVSEIATSTYTAVFSGACDANGHVTLTAGATSTCTITNNDNFGLLTIIKQTLFGNGSFIFALTGSTTATTSITTSGGFGTTTIPLTMGTTTLSEASIGGWAFTSGSCMQNGTTTGIAVLNGVTIFSGVFGNNYSCTIVNTATSTGMLTVIKNVVGGTATSGDFAIHVKNATTSSATTSIDVAGSPQNGTSTGTTYAVMAGAYIVSETGGPGDYTLTFSGACNANGEAVVNAGATSTCIITNTFITPTPSGGGGGSTAVSSGGGGGGNGPISTILPNNAPAPILGGGGFSPGQVLGNSVSLPNDGMGGYVPGVPNTGSGGLAAGYVIIMLLCFAALLGGIVSLRRN